MGGVPHVAKGVDQNCGACGVGADMVVIWLQVLVGGGDGRVVVNSSGWRGLPGEGNQRQGSVRLFLRPPNVQMPRRKNRSRNILRPTTPTDDDGDCDGGGWSVIPGRYRGTLHLPSQSPSDDHPNTTTTTTTTGLEAALKRAQHTLLGHPLLQPLRDALPKEVGGILVLGLGSLHSPTALSSLLQLAMVLSLLPLLASAPRVRFIDPVFTAGDVEFLSQFGVATASTGEESGEKEEVQSKGQETVLLAPHLDFSVLHSYLSLYASTGAMPAVILSNDVRRFLELLVPHLPPAHCPSH